MDACDGRHLRTAMHELRAQRRVRVKFPVESGYPLVSAWDLGINDATAIWAAQVVGYELRWRKFLSEQR